MVRHCDITIEIALLFASEQEAKSHDDVVFSKQTWGTSGSRGDGGLNDSSENFSYTIAENRLKS